MIEIEVIKAISDIAQSVTVTGILVYWVLVERRARNDLSAEILSDWRELKENRAN